MRAKIFVVLESVFLGLGMLVLTPSINPTTERKDEQPAANHRRTGFSTVLPAPVRRTQRHRPQPLAVWECITSWYGEDFDGLPTATGETYDMYGETAAHPTLPLGRSCEW